MEQCKKYEEITGSQFETSKAAGKIILIRLNKQHYPVAKLTLYSFGTDWIIYVVAVATNVSINLVWGNVPGP